MKRIVTRLHRALMFFLALAPVCAFAFRGLLDSFALGVIWLLAQTVVAALFTLLPAYVGNYREYEVIRREGGSGSADPNPDREVSREIVKEGHRFPLRLAADLALLALDAICLLWIPRAAFSGGNVFCKAGFLALMAVTMLLSMNNLASAQCLWLDVPGVLAGAFFYLIMALYLRFTKADVSGLTPFISVCAVLFLFFGSVSLNRQSIAMSMATHAGDQARAPRQIARRNRRIVLGFAAIVTGVSLVSPIRSALIWCLARIGDGVRWFLRLLRGGSGAENAPLPPLDALVATPDSAPVAVAEVSEVSRGSEIIVYIFLGVVALGLIWMIFDGLRKLIDKLTKWMERFAAGVNEGFYDEREELMSAEEMRDRLRSGVKNRVKSLFARETPWEKLSGRERARRMMRDFYKKRARKIPGLRALTAREAVRAADGASETADRFTFLYERARYSSKPVDAAEADQTKKDMRL